MLLELSISVRYPGKTHPIRDVKLALDDGEIVGLAGESGSGKSTVALAIMGLSRYRGAAVEGEILFRGRDLLKAGERELRRIRGREIALVLQSPLASLNPALRIGTQIAETWKAHESGDGWRARAAELFERMRLPREGEFLRKYPRQLSVGQAQRVLIAMALLHKPALLIADEATSALDVITQAEILALFRELNRAFGMAILYISHDLASVAGICDRIAILHDGSIVESGETLQVLTNPQHEYTQRLIAAMPKLPQRADNAKAASV